MELVRAVVVALHVLCWTVLVIVVLAASRRPVRRGRRRAKGSAPLVVAIIGIFVTAVWIVLVE